MPKFFPTYFNIIINKGEAVAWNNVKLKLP